MVEITPLDAAFGAEVRGWEPSRPPDPALVRQLQRALDAHHVLVLRGHPTPTDAQLVRFAAGWGELAETAAKYGLDLPDDRMLYVSNELDDRGVERGAAGSGSIPWHHDYAFWERPGQESFLEAQHLPPGGGPWTCFCDMYAAWDALPDELRERVRHLIGVHTLHAAGAYAEPTTDDEELRLRAAQANPDLRYPDDGAGARHPVAIRHPRSGRIALYVSSFVREFEGVGHDEGRELLDRLLGFAHSPEREYCHAWQQGDLVVFDTVGTVHRREEVLARQHRTMRQMSTLFDDTHR